jgi:hypothetical protein
LKCKFHELARTKLPTADPNCPSHVCYAKHIYYKSVLATDGWRVGSEDGGDFNNERNGVYEGKGNKRDCAYEENEEEEDGIGENNNTYFSFSANKQEQPTVAAAD